jgi:hypothetical protein
MMGRRSTEIILEKKKKHADEYDHMVAVFWYPCATAIAQHCVLPLFKK